MLAEVGNLDLTTAHLDVHLVHPIDQQVATFVIVDFQERHRQIVLKNEGMIDGVGI